MGSEKNKIDFQELEEIISKFLYSLKCQLDLDEEKNLKNSNQTTFKNGLVKSIQKFKKGLIHIEKNYHQLVDEIDQTYHEITKQRKSDKTFLAKELKKIKTYNSYDYFDDFSPDNFSAKNSHNFFNNICKESLIKNITELEIVLHLSIKNNKKGGPYKKLERRELIYGLRKFYEFYTQKEFGYNKEFRQFFCSVIQPIENLEEYGKSGIAKSNSDELCSTWKDLVLDLKKFSHL